VGSGSDWGQRKRLTAEVFGGRSPKIFSNNTKIVELLKSIVATGVNSKVIFLSGFSSQGDLNKDTTIARWS